MLHLIVAFGLQAAAEPGVGRAVPPNSNFYGAPVDAVDHEAVVLYNRIAGGQGERPVSLVRSGRWLRESGGLAAVYSDFESGTSISYLRDESGQYRAMAIARTATTDTYSRYRRERTGRHDRALGEDCEVWSLVRVGDTRRDGAEVLSCETHDGIQLWTRSQGRSNKFVIAESRTLSFRRRAVRPEEVRPPADLLRWAYWRDLAPEGAPPPPPPARVDYDLRLANLAGSGGEQTRIMRRGGPWTYQDSTREQGARRITLDNRLIALTYESEADGRPVSLALRRLPPDQVGMGDRAAFPRIEPPRSERVIGETCLWTDPDAGGGVVVTSGSQGQCLTADGLPLRILSHHRVVIADLTATALRRGRPPLDSVMPPREAFDWARWGIRPAD